MSKKRRILGILGIVFSVISLIGGITSILRQVDNVQESLVISNRNLPNVPAMIVPTFVITAVVQDTSVTIQTSNFPAGDTFNVHMNFYGTQGIGGTVVDTINSGAGGRLTLTFSIPEVFHGQEKIAIRLESTTSGYYTYNWFYNDIPKEVVIPPSYTGYPTFGIMNITKDEAITIQGLNFPPGDTFNVHMNYYGTQGVTGAIVETITIGADGSLPDSTYDIPAFLHDQHRIAIRLESPSSGYYAFNWFYNNTSAPPLINLLCEEGSGLNPVPLLYTNIKIAWPKRMEVDQQDSIHFSVYPDEQSPKNSSEFENRNYIVSTPMNTIGDNDCVLEEKSFPDYDVCLTAEILTAGEVIISSDGDTKCYPIEQPNIMRDWIITAKSTGPQLIIINVEKQWNLSKNEIRTDVLLRQEISLNVKEPFIELGTLNVASILSVVIGGIFGFFFKSLARKKAGEEEKRKKEDKPKILLP